MKRVVRTILRLLRNLVIGLSLLVLFGLWALRSSYVQERLLPVVDQFLEKQLGVAVEIGGLDLDLPARVVARKVAMYDQQGQKMFAVHEVQVSLLSFSLWDIILHPGQPKALSVSHLQLIHPEAHLYRSRRDSTLNIDFLSKSKKDSSSSGPMALDLELEEIRLRGGIFTYIDSTASDERLAPNGRVNFKNMQFRRINGDLSFHLHPDQRMDAGISKLSFAEDQVPLYLNEFASQTHLYQDPKDPAWLLICLDETRLRTGRTNLKFSGQLANQRPDTSFHGFYPVFSADFQPSSFDFNTLNYLLPKPLPMRDPARLEGFLWGDMQGIWSDSLTVAIYDSTKLQMRMELTDYTSEDDLRFDLGIMEGQIQFEELQRFLPGTDIPLAGLAKVKGGIKGDLSMMRSRDLEVRYGKQTDLYLKAQIFDYTKGDNIVMDLSFADSHLSFKEAGELVPSMQLPPWLEGFGRTEIKGRFIGGPSDFVVHGDMFSQYGNVNANLHLMLPPIRPDISYDGWVTTEGLNLNSMASSLPVTSRNFNFEGKIKGHGTDFKTMEADIEGKITDSYIDEFFFRSIVTDSLRIRNQRITGGVNLRDPNGDGTMKVNVLLSDTLKEINLEGLVSNVDLDHYKVVPGDSLKFSAAINAHLRGDSLEDYTGGVEAKNLRLVRSRTEDSLLIDKIDLESSLSERHEHFLHVRSPILDMDMRGTFTYRKALGMVTRISQEISMFIQNNDTVIDRYYREKILEPEDVFIWDTITVQDSLNSLLAFFKVPFYVEPGSKLYWQLEHGMTDNVDLRLVSDSIGFDQVGLKGNVVTLNVFKDGSQNSLLFSGESQVEQLNVGKNLTFHNVMLRPEGGDSLMNVELRAEQPDIGNKYNLVTRTLFRRGGGVATQIRPQESILLIRGKEWRFDKGNFITRTFEHPPSLAEHEYPDSVIARYNVRNLSMSESGQKIAINGYVSEDFLDILEVTIDGLKISSLMEILDEPLDIDGRVVNSKLSAYNLLTDRPTMDWNVLVQDFRYEQGDSLDVRFEGGWPRDEKGEIAGVELRVGHAGADSLVVSGTYNMAMDSLDLESRSSSFMLEWIEPFMEGVLSDMQGKLSVDHFTVQGPLKAPKLNGVVHLVDAGFKVDYLNNFFRLSDDNISFNNQGATIKGITIFDTLGGRAVLKGKILQQGGNFTARLKLDSISDLTVMDTRKGLNSDFYGHVVLQEGEVTVSGLLPSVLVTTDVTTGPGTWLDIPLSDYTSARRLDFVHFVREGDTLSTDSIIDIGGIALEMTVNATNDARVRLIFDEKVGDIIEARGAGTITLSVDKDGEFKMIGNYVVDEGNYLFTAENIVNKKFLVEKGGSITWNGDPYDAQVAITALYKVNADISALVPNSTTRVPVEIVMRMTGSLMQPKIDLELRMDQLNSQDVMGLASYFRTIQYDQQELNKQVVSLLLFRRFTGHSATGGGGVAGAGVTSSISELISNQVNFWISQAFDNANVGVELNTNEFQDVELALKASLFNNKVTVERNGAIVSNNGSGFSIGDLSVQIKLLPASDSSRVDPEAGQLVMEIFNREDATLNNANNISRGLGLFYKKDFDRISDLFKGKGSRKEDKKEDQKDEPKKEDAKAEPKEEETPDAVEE